MTVGRLVRVRGTVQGVGFRPFVWRLAAEEGIAGRVGNDGGGVFIEAFADQDRFARFLDRLEREAPPLARITAVDVSGLDGPPPPGFAIAESGAGPAATAVAADAATCPDCLAEIADPAARRFAYAFTNCTRCGPRFSIVRAIPWDRANTSMAAFPMCADCAREYADPADRRFHAEPVACPACGPRLALVRPDGSAIPAADPVVATAALLRAGEIVAIKGLGGYQLACDACDAAAVARLRARKHRARKPFALMARDLAMVRIHGACDAADAAILAAPDAPILLLDRHMGDTGLAPAVAPGQATLGVMLPATPLHHRLMALLDRPIVLTSGNLTDEPQAIDDGDALIRLGPVADAVLRHDRVIVSRLDDSVVRRIGGAPRVLRRGRGLAPAPLPLPDAPWRGRRVLATGADLKNAFCLLTGSEAVLSQHIGDLAEPAAAADLGRAVRLSLDLYRFAPEAVAVDLHPDCRSRRLGLALARELGIPAVAVQHHHAHIAACLAENGRADDAPPVVGIALDGAGHGTDGTVWGGEVLVAGYRGFERAGHLLPVALPGGDAAAREPWRNAFAHIEAAIGFAAAREAWPGLPVLGFLAGKPVADLTRLCSSPATPRASSMGRLFDAVAAALGLVVARQDYEGEAAGLVEAAAVPAFADAAPYPVGLDGTAPLVVSWAPLWRALLADLAAGAPPALVAARFHRGVIAALSTVATRIAAERGLVTVALSGGAFHNRLLLEGIAAALADAGLDVLTHRAVPAGDGGLALGQAAVVAATL